MIEAFFVFLLGTFGSVWSLYFLFFTAIVLTGVGSPIPEEATLIIGGYLAYLGFFEYWDFVWLAVSATLIADMIGFFIGKYYGDWAEERICRSRYLGWVLKRGKEYFEKYGDTIVIFSRPVIGLRAVVPILAGHCKMKTGKFLIFDASSAIPWVVFLISLSYILGTGLDLLTETKELKYAIFILFLGLIIFFEVRRFFKKRNGEKSC